MKKEKFSKLELAIQKKFLYWSEFLHLGHWDIELRFEKFTDENNKQDGKWEAVAKCDANPEYLEATISVNTNKIKIVDDEIIVHELLHAMFADFTGYLYANHKQRNADRWKGWFEERIINTLSKIIVRNHKK